MAQLIKDELDRRDKLSAYVEREVDRVWKTHERERRIFFGIVVVTAGFVGILIGKSYVDVQRSITNAKQAATNAIEDAALVMRRMETNISHQAAVMTNKVALEVLRVETETRKQIAEQFQSTSIQALINSEAKRHINLVAEPLITSNVTRYIEPWRNETKEQLDKVSVTLTDLLEKGSLLESIMGQATNSLDDLKETTTFITRAVLAAHDDRTAFEWLSNLGKSATNKYGSEAKQITDRLASSYYRRLDDPYNLIPWNDAASNRSSWPMRTIMSVWKRLPSKFATDFVGFVNAHTNILEEEKLSFMRNAYLHDSRQSLQAASHAANAFAHKFGIDHNTPFEHGPLEAAWATYIKTNHLFRDTLTNSTNFIHEIFLPSDTDRFFVVKELENAKLILLRLKHPPLPNLEGNVIFYEGNDVVQLKDPGVHKNIVTALLSPWKELKIEVRYEQNATESNFVGNITNSVVIGDGTIHFPD